MVPTVDYLGTLYPYQRDTDGHVRLYSRTSTSLRIPSPTRPPPRRMDSTSRTGSGERRGTYLLRGGYQSGVWRGGEGTSLPHTGRGVGIRPVGCATLTISTPYDPGHQVGRFLRIPAQLLVPTSRVPSTPLHIAGWYPPSRPTSRCTLPISSIGGLGR
jgi:hypothetical protein